METVSQDLFGNMLATPYILISNFARADGSPGGLFKYVPSTQSLTYVTEPTGIVTGLDSMKFNGAQNILYGTRGSFNGQNTYNTVVAVVSCDGWATACLAYSFQTSCIKTTNTAGSIPPNPPGVQLIQNVVTGTEDFVIMCNGGFSGADVGFQIVKNANNYVTNTKISSVCGITPPSPPPVPPPVPPTPVNTATSSSKSATVAIVGSTGGILLIILMVYWYYTTQNCTVLILSTSASMKLVHLLLYH